ncbi:hypothetical protein EJP617_25510 [Erwinia sp. Ejp617]|nr:hypothetical protein EJP617_25510 [Erwinia sp. Ejp617]
MLAWVKAPRITLNPAHVQRYTRVLLRKMSTTHAYPERATGVIVNQAAVKQHGIGLWGKLSLS